MKLLLSCPFGISSLLAQELKRFQLKPYGTFSTGTFVETDLRGLYQINLRSRLANKVYLQIAAGEVRDFDQLFEKVKKSDYAQRSSNSKISIKVVSHHSQLSSQRSIQSVAHKAILESIAHFSKEQEETTELLLILEKNQLSLFINTSGASLHQRGYREKTGLAPLKENLAAAMVLFSGRKFKSPLIDPFCGSGTIAIEALLIAKNIAPGLRRNFAFQQFSRYDQHLLAQLRAEAESKIFDGKYQIYASDLDPKMITLAKANAKNRGLDQDIHFEAKKFQKSDFSVFSDERFWILTNPPYGKRISAPDLPGLYADLQGSFGKNGYGGIITNAPYLHFDRQDRSEKKLFNGEESCSFWYRKLS